jgi:hypothetical protein
LGAYEASGEGLVYIDSMDKAPGAEAPCDDTIGEERVSEAAGTDTMLPSDRECTRKEHSASVVF